MNIHEYQAKELLSKFGVPGPAGHAAMSVDEAVEAAKKLPGPLWVVKAQIHAGGRGKGTLKEVPSQRGVQLVKSAEEAATVAKNILGNTLVTIQTGDAGKQVGVGRDRPVSRNEMWREEMPASVARSSWLMRLWLRHSFNCSPNCMGVSDLPSCI